jgi:hypothetical protein
MGIKMKTKIIILCILFGVLLAGSAEARVIDQIFDNIDDYVHVYDTVNTDGRRVFSETYSVERKVVDGILFFMLFLSISILSLTKWYGKSSPAVNGIAISLSALMTLSLLSFTNFTVGLLFPFAKNILFFIMLLIVYSIVNKNIIKGKIWSLIVATIITLIMFNVEGLIEDVTQREGFNIFDSTQKALNPMYNSKVWNSQAAGCSNGVRDAHYINRVIQWEEGVDCGGPCPPCTAAVMPTGPVTPTKPIITPPPEEKCTAVKKSMINVLAIKELGNLNICIDEQCTCEKNSLCSSVEGCAKACSYDLSKQNIEWSGTEVSGTFGLMHIRKIGVKDLKECQDLIKGVIKPPVATAASDTFRTAWGKEPSLEDYNNIYDYINKFQPKFFSDKGISRQSTKAAWDRMTKDAAKGPALVEAAKKYKNYLANKAKYG